MGPCVALLSNPRSTGNKSLLPRVRSYCAAHTDIFHYEVERADQIGEALRTIARVKPKVLVINGGDGTVQATLTEMHTGNYFDGVPPPVAVLPNGKTNLIALDLGASGDPIAALERILKIARSDSIEAHVVPRELISLSDGVIGTKPVLGMFLGGAGLADSILFCRHKVYPLGLPNGFSHFLTAIAVLLSLILGLRAAFLPPQPSNVKISLLRSGQIQGHFALLIVTTLQRLLLAGNTSVGGHSGLKMVAVDQRPMSLLRAVAAQFTGKLESARSEGIHLERDDEIRIEGGSSGVILDGEIFMTRPGFPIILKPTAPQPFLRLAA